MREIIQKIAGESTKWSNSEQNKKTDEITRLKNLSGLQEDFSGEKKIYIHKAKDIEKFYAALVHALEKDSRALDIIKDVFNRVIY